MGTSSPRMRDGFEPEGKGQKDVEGVGVGLVAQEVALPLASRFSSILLRYRCCFKRRPPGEGQVASAMLVRLDLNDAQRWMPLQLVVQHGVVPKVARGRD